MTATLIEAPVEQLETVPAGPDSKQCEGILPCPIHLVHRCRNDATARLDVMCHGDIDTIHLCQRCLILSKVYGGMCPKCGQEPHIVDIEPIQ
jgi:hypothetical protein